MEQGECVLKCLICIQVCIGSRHVRGLLMTPILQSSRGYARIIMHDYDD